MKATDKLRKAIVVLLDCDTQVKAKKCAQRIDTIINEIDADYESFQNFFHQVEWTVEEGD